MSIKLNLGSNNKIIGDDWINVDGLDLPNVDLICDLNIVPFKFTSKNNIKNIFFNKIYDETKIGYYDGRNPQNNHTEIDFKLNNNSVDEIQMVEVLEHISFHNTLKILQECYRILKPEGKLHIQVPDCGKAMEYYINKQICECVPHKSMKGDSSGIFKADDNCNACKGQAKINPKRWLYSFTGAQKHEFDIHRMIFTKEILEKILIDAGFNDFEFKDDTYKLKINIYK